MSLRDMFIAFFIIVVWGVNFVVISYGLEGMPPLLMGGIRFLMVASIGSLFFKRPKTPLKWWFAYALPISFLQFSFLFSSMAFGMPAGLASLVLQSQVLFSLFFALIFLKESIRLFQLVAMSIAIGGLLLIALSIEQQSMTTLAFGLALAGGASWALGNICTRAISQKGYDSNVNLVIWSAWIPPLPFFICSFLFEGSERIQTSLINLNMQSIAALLYLSVVASIIGYGLWSYLLSRYTAAQVTPLTLGVPLVGLASAFLILNEKITTIQWFGTCLVLVGLLINTFYGRLKGKIIAPA